MPGTTLFPYIPASAIHAENQLFPFMLRIPELQFIATDAGGATSGIQKIMEWTMISPDRFLLNLENLSKRFRIFPL
jgi:hypothetical protein